MSKKIVEIIVFFASIAFVWRFGCLTYYHVWAGSFAENENRTFHVNHAIGFSALTILSFSVSIWMLVRLLKKNKAKGAMAH
jgi:uncharacterized membrane protein